MILKTKNDMNEEMCNMIDEIDDLKDVITYLNNDKQTLEREVCQKRIADRSIGKYLEDCFPRKYRKVVSNNNK